MIEGAEILSKKEIMELTEPFWVQIFPLAYILIITLVIFGLFTLAKKHDLRLFGIILLAIYIIAMACQRPINHMIEKRFTEEVPTGRYQYEIIVSNDTDIVALHEKYEVINIDGTVYTVTEKETESE